MMIRLHLSSLNWYQRMDLDKDEIENGYASLDEVDTDVVKDEVFDLGGLVGVDF